MTTHSYGLSTWDETVSNTGNTNRSSSNDQERIPFVRLQEGNNILRIITAPYKYNMVRFKASEDERGFGKRVNCSWPVEECPTAKAGFKPKSRWLVGVIDRSDNAVKVFDMSVLVYQQLQGIKEDIEYGNPDQFDINIRMNSKAGPTGYYTVLPRGKSALSEADVALKEASAESLESTLVRLSTPPKAETVLKRMEELGYTGGVVAGSGGNGSTAEDLPAADDESYSFDQRPAAQA